MVTRWHETRDFESSFPRICLICTFGGWTNRGANDCLPLRYAENGAIDPAIPDA